MKSFFLFFFCIAFSVISVVEAAETTKLKISSSDIPSSNNENFVHRSKTLSTLTEKILKEAYKQLNLEIEVNYLPSERAIWSANKNITDGVLFRAEGIDERFPNLLQIKVPLLETKISVYTEDVHFDVKGWESIKPYRIAYLRGLKIVEKNTQEIKPQTFKVNTFEQALKMLNAKRVDIVVAGNFNNTNQNIPEYPDIKVLEPPVAKFPVYHYLHKKHQDLIPKLEAILTKMHEDKTIETIKVQFLQQNR